MTSSEIEQRLIRAIQSGNFQEETEELVKILETASASVDSVKPILRFMETHPEEDFGSPGPLVHFVETFYRHGYEEQLLQSLRRKPTAHTLWMLNRLANGAEDEDEFNRYLDVFEESLTHPEADQAAREAADDFLSDEEENSS